MGFTGQLGQHPQQQDTMVQYKDVPYRDLPEPTRVEIDRTFQEFKMPLRLALDEVSKSKGRFLVDLQEELRKIYLSVLNIENQQAQLQQLIRPYLDEVKNISKDARICRTNGLQQIKNNGIAMLLFHCLTSYLHLRLYTTSH